LNRILARIGERATGWDRAWDWAKPMGLSLALIVQAYEMGEGLLAWRHSWFLDPHFCRSAFRDGGLPVNRFKYEGFRFCCLPQDLLLYT